MSVPRIAVTMGDPAGIGPEICLRLLSAPRDALGCLPLVFGDAEVLERVAERCGLPAPRVVPRAASAGEAAVVHCPSLDAAALVPGRVTADTGRAAHAYILAAIEAVERGDAVGVATAPIHKEALRAAGIPFPGHTEIFAHRTRTSRYCMMLTSREITCSLVTTHVGYRDVPGLLTEARIRDAIELTADAMRRILGRPPRLAVCGLNPHAGEHGLFGDGEEERWIAPAVAAAAAAGQQIVGPLPADTAFVPARRRETDAYVCMYHDQGLIPLKALAFDTAVNVTLGLPLVRTSVDHGTALDIAWQGKASAVSLIEAVRLAVRLGVHR